MHVAKRIVLVTVGVGLAAWTCAPRAAAGGNRQDEARVELGRRLFLDPVASQGGKFSCASCHDPEHGFSDPRTLSRDENGPTARHSQPVTDLGTTGFHWDGEFDDVRELLVARLGMPRDALEQSRRLATAHHDAAVRDGLEVDEKAFQARLAALRPPYYGPAVPGRRIARGPIVAVLEEDGRYDEGMKRAYGSAQVTNDRLIDAVAAYMETLRTTEGPWDRHRAGDSSALSAPAQRGLALFEGKAGCASCHTTEGRDGRRLSDDAYHDTGVAFRVAPRRSTLVPQVFAALSAPTDGGRAAQTFAGAHAGRFKTPSLRDVARRAPYMHDGSLATLADVVDYYDGGGTPHAQLDPKIKPLGLSAGERGDLVAFLEALSGDERAGLGAEPHYRAPKTRVRVKSADGRDVTDLKVRVRPAGDRLRGTDAMPEPFECTTDAWGWIEFSFPASTHVLLEADDVELGVSRLLPDWLRRYEVVAVPRSTVAVRVRRAEESDPLPAQLELRPLAASGQTSDALVTLYRAQRLDANTNLYTARREDVQAALGVPTRGLVAMQLRNVGGGSGVYEIDVDGGQSEPIDLRIDPAGPSPRRPLDERRERRDGDGTRGTTPRDAGPGRPTPRAETGGTPTSR